MRSDGFSVAPGVPAAGGCAYPASAGPSGGTIVEGVPGKAPGSDSFLLDGDFLAGGGGAVDAVEDFLDGEPGFARGEEGGVVKAGVDPVAEFGLEEGVELLVPVKVGE